MFFEWLKVPRMMLLHAQSQLASAVAVRSPHEYIQWLQVYVRRLCRESAVRRLRELLDDLRGPTQYVRLVEAEPRGPRLRRHCGGIVEAGPRAQGSCRPCGSGTKGGAGLVEAGPRAQALCGSGTKGAGFVEAGPRAQALWKRDQRRRPCGGGRAN